MPARRYSCLNAIIGSTLEARRAGRNPATAATTSRTAGVTAIDAQSIRPRPNSALDASLLSARLMGKPNAVRVEHKTLAHDQPQHARARGAKRHPQADFIGAPRHRIGHDAVDADTREAERQEAEKARQLRDQPLADDRPVHLGRKRRHIGHGQMRIDLRNGSPNVRPRRGGVAGGAGFENR